MILFLYQSKCVLKIIEFALSRQLNDLNRSNLYFGHVAEWLRRGLQIPYSNRLILCKHCIIQQFKQVFYVGHSWDIEIKK